MNRPEFVRKVAAAIAPAFAVEVGRTTLHSGRLTSKNLHGLGRALAGARIALGLTQRELAKRLNVDESQISRDERNDYHGITVERASRILDAMGIETTTELHLAVSAHPKSRRARELIEV